MLTFKQWLARSYGNSGSNNNPIPITNSSNTTPVNYPAGKS